MNRPATNILYQILQILRDIRHRLVGLEKSTVSHDLGNSIDPKTFPVIDPKVFKKLNKELANDKELKLAMVRKKKVSKFS